MVSEETSQISLARRGVLRRGLTPEQLRARLSAEADGAERTGGGLKGGPESLGSGAPAEDVEDVIVTSGAGAGTSEGAADGVFEGEDGKPQTV